MRLQMFAAAISSMVALPVLGPVQAQTFPDFSGLWAHPSVGWEYPVSGPGPVRHKPGATGSALLIGDDTNPVLTPSTAAIIRRNSQISQSGLAFPDPDNQCMSQPVPYIFWNFEIQLLQQPDKVTILYNHDHDFREVWLNRPHLATIVPSWHGDSIGHYEGDTLVVDTIGIKTGKFSSIDRFGTPYTDRMHVVERYRFIDYDAAKESQARGEKEWGHVGAYDVDPAYRGRGLQLEFKVDDPGVFTMPWTATVTYLPSIHTEWEERVCAENVEHYYSGATQYYSDKQARIPTALRPDF
jgi:hypothetical protein